MRLLLVALSFLLCSPAAAEAPAPFAKLSPHIEKFKELGEQDAMLSRVAKNAVKEGNVARLVEIMRTQSIIRTQEIENRSKMLEALCSAPGNACAEAAQNLQNQGSLLQTSLTEMRVAMAGKPLSVEESAGVLHIGTNLQKEYMDALFSLLRYTVVSMRKKDEATPVPDIFSLKELPELADIPMLPPPPGVGDMRLGK